MPYIPSAMAIRFHYTMHKRKRGVWDTLVHLLQKDQGLEKVDQAIKQSSREMKYRPHYDNYPLLKTAYW